MNILLTGGAGYIGSHTAVTLSKAGYDVILYDNFCNSDKNVLNRLQSILGKSLLSIEGDVRDTTLLIKVLQDYEIDSVIHLAGLKAVGESTKNPIDYYANNVQGSINLLEAMEASNVKKLVFSSSATVYGDPQYLPIDENHPTNPTNAYGRTKLHIEEMLKDIVKAYGDWSIVCLRYFNPVGAHISGLIGEEPNGIPNNLMPYITQVASGQLPYLNIYGNDYSTSDGTGVRDYIHVVDLAEGHLAALNYLEVSSGLDVINLGTGHGYSVIEMVKAYEKASGLSIPYKFTNRRLGDIAECYADVSKARHSLNWEAKHELSQISESLVRWMKDNGINDE